MLGVSPHGLFRRGTVGLGATEPGRGGAAVTCAPVRLSISLTGLGRAGPGSARCGAAQPGAACSGAARQGKGLFRLGRLAGALAPGWSA